MTKPRIEFKNKSPKSIKRYITLVQKLHDNGYTITQAKKMNDNELRSALQSNAKSMNPTKRLLGQISANKEHRFGTRNKTLKHYKNKGYNPNRLDDLRKELTLTTGSSFFAIANELKKEYNLSQKESYKMANRLMAIPKSQYNKLKEVQKTILLDFESP